MAKSKESGIGVVDGVSNGADQLLSAQLPYTAEITIVGTADLLFNRFNEEEYEEKAASQRGSSIRKTDIHENRIYRDHDGDVAMPAVYLTNSLTAAGKYKTDPRNARASMMGLCKAGIVPYEEYSKMVSVTGETTKEGWDYLDKRGACIQRARVVKARPAFFKGWRTTILLEILVPEYISLDVLSELCTYAGRFVGVGDYRPTYGRFRVESLKLHDGE